MTEQFAFSEVVFLLGKQFSNVLFVISFLLFDVICANVYVRNPKLNIQHMPFYATLAFANTALKESADLL